MIRKLSRQPPSHFEDVANEPRVDCEEGEGATQLKRERIRLVIPSKTDTEYDLLRGKKNAEPRYGEYVLFMQHIYLEIPIAAAKKTTTPAVVDVSLDGFPRSVVAVTLMPRHIHTL